MPKKRLKYIDFAKGIAILLVIIGHTNNMNESVRSVIYSFHIPLFFVVSAITFKFATNKKDYLNKVKKLFKHLFVPALIIYIVNTIVFILCYSKSILPITIKDIITIIIGFINCNDIPNLIKIDNSFPVGIQWFLIVLFFGLIIYNYLYLKLNKKQFILSTIICSIIGLIIGKIVSIPFLINAALVSQLFFLCGYLYKQYDIEKKNVLLLSFILWLITFISINIITGKHLDIATGIYPILPICFICAISGTLFVLSSSKYLVRYKIISKPIEYIGKYSLILYIVHCFDRYFIHIYSTQYVIINIIIRIIIDLIIFVIMMNITKIKKVMQMK